MILVTFLQAVTRWNVNINCNPCAVKWNNDSGSEYGDLREVNLFLCKSDIELSAIIFSYCVYINTFEK